MTRWREQGTAQSSAAGKGLRHRRAGRPLAWVTAMLAAGALAAGSSAAFAAPAAGSVAVTAAHGWTIAPSPNVTAPQGEFSGVWCAKAAACIAVGHRVAASGALVALAQLWNGKKWVTTGTAGLHLATFSAVSCTSASACTAVGNYTGETDAAFTLAEGWNGTTWSVQAPPAGSAEESSLAAVSCSAKAACTAVGQSPNGLPLAERWNGSQWTIQATAGSSALTGVSCATAHACTAIGGRVAERWDGTAWTLQHPRTPGGARSFALSAVSCASASACLAAGSSVSHTGTRGPLSETWNGKNWAVHAAPSPAGAASGSFGAVSCSARAACEAAGGYASGIAARPVLAEGWNGSRWAIQRTTIPAGPIDSTLSGVSCTSASHCVAVGASTAARPPARRTRGTAS